MIRCADCHNDVDPLITKGNPEWFDSYHCPRCENEIGRRKGDQFYWWNGRDFVERDIK